MKRPLNVKKLTALLVLILITSLSVNGQMKTVYCPPNKEPVMVPKKPQKFYESYVKKTTLNLKGTISVLDKIKLGDIDAGTKRDVVELREKLNQYSSQTEDIIKASVLGFCMAPCDKDVRAKHYALLENISKQNAEIEKLKSQLSKIEKAGNAAGIDDEKVKSVIKSFDTENADKIFKKS